jgi:glycosyltransferase involved in cell wall biosynthesis
MIAALVVTHNSEFFLARTLSSILQQTQLPDLFIAVDDNSSDSTVSILREHGFLVFPATTTATDITTRIAQNFVQGVKAAQDQGAGTLILGDHDDFWHPDRVKHQVEILALNAGTSLLASDGTVSETTTIRTTFPVPADFNDWDRDRKWRYVSRRSIATGGASALVPTNLSTIDVPVGWLHDRWWSLRAVRESSMLVDPTPVIDYHLSESQQVGLATHGQGNPVKRVVHKITHFPQTMRKLTDISGLLAEE